MELHDESQSIKHVLQGGRLYPHPSSAAGSGGFLAGLGSWEWLFGARLLCRSPAKGAVTEEGGQYFLLFPLE